jgi:Domain of unknown function (DUF4279)
MIQMSGSGTSTMKSTDASRTFASLRFRGDRLEPGDVTDILEANPTTAYRKGEVYKRSRGQEVRGRTGVWILSSKDHVRSSDLNEHLQYLLAVLFPRGSNDRVERLRALLRDGRITADVNCFWYGAPGSRVPAIPDEITTAFARLPARIEQDLYAETAA